ncbi:hypothetical protein H4R19_006699, partial [Coemansia spiralis]
TGDAVTVVASTEVGGLNFHQTAVSSRALLRSDVCKDCVSRCVGNTEFFELVSEPHDLGEGLGIVSDASGRVRGLWVPFPNCAHVPMTRRTTGLDAALMLPTLEQLRRTEVVPDPVHVLDVEFSHEPLAAARALGVSDDRMASLLRAAPGVRSVLAVSKILQKRPAGVASLEVGDIILSANGAVVGHIDEVACFYSGGSVELTVVRRGTEQTILVPTLPMSGTATRRVVNWAGMYLQEPYQQALQQATRAVSQVYNFTNMRASPAVIGDHRFHMFVTEIGGTKVHSLDDLIAVVCSLKDPELAAFNAKVAANQPLLSSAMPGRDVKLRTVMLNGEDLVKTIRTNDQYFPAWQLTRGPRLDDEWVYEEL